MVFKKKVKSETALTDLEIAKVKEEVSLSKEDVRVEAEKEKEAPVAEVSGGRFTQEELDLFKEVTMVLGNLLKISNNVPMRVGIKKYISMLTPMSREAVKE